MMVVTVTDPLDPRIEPYRAVRERDLVGRSGLVVIEGEVVLRTLLSGRSRFRPRSLLLARPRLAPLASLLAALPDDVPVHVAEQPLLDAIAGFPIHRGVLAIAERGETPSAASLLAGLQGPALVVGLVGLANHDNVGGVFRNAAAFGAAAVLLDATTCDPLYRKAIRVSVGATLTVPFGRAESAAAMARDLAAAGFDVVALGPRGGEALETVCWRERTALLLGAEGAGLPQSLLDTLRVLRITMAPGFDSLNVATASGIALWSASRRPSVGRPGD